MRAIYLLYLVLGITGQTTLDQPPGLNTFTPTPTLTSSLNLAPSVTPNIIDPKAPNAQSLCAGYKASNVVTNNASITADLTLAGAACDVYGNDILDLLLEVEYQNATRLNVKVYPKYIVPSNRSLYILDDSLSPSGSIDLGSTAASSELIFEWSNEPSFQFRVVRKGSGETIFDTYGSKIVFEDQFLEVVTSMVPSYNIYGLPEAIRGSFRLPNNYVQTFWNQYNEMNDQPIDANMHCVHPVYLETRYGDNSSKSHVVYGRNLHGQEWIMRPEQLIYRTIGGSIDFYFFSGPTPTEAIAQQQVGVIKTAAMQPYWSFGFHQVRWGYQNWTVLQNIIDGYADANIQLEAIWNDLDYLLQYRIFTHDNNTYPVPQGQEFLTRLHANGQYWMPILDPNVYVPDPTNATDANPTYNRGDELGLYIRRGEGHEDYYVGDQWPGFSVWPDFLLERTQDFWTNEMIMYHEQLAFDGWWLDISDLSSWCTGSCGTGRLDLNPIHVPFKLPGEPGQINYDYPEAFDITNATEAASASHWGGDTNSRWGNMYMTIPQALTFSVAGVPYFGVETCGFNGNTDMELCTRWMELSAFFPFYRNHNSRNTIAQEAFRWATTAEGTRRAMHVRFQLLPYWYTLFYHAHTRGDTVLRALSWNFPNEEILKSVDNQFMVGPSILVTPVLAPLLQQSQGVFPGVATGTRWYDWYTLQEVQASPGQNVSLPAPLEVIPVHLRGGTIIASQKPGNTTKTTRMNPWTFIVALNKNEQAHGDLYLDDGVSLEPSDIKIVTVSRSRFSNKKVVC
ncbi:hypothetical protein P280DRAFT_391630 [Massarina eburnea CBS 473.64]|uniref:alpha-glucosidase n=1 Tax=Massarina eburnea CBS 473.64 TaxID=1395130 RepID=A0A6A6SD26_9PLEO|nr:hypothetical protein P280DRAFT_391630 [Massarina eburnea CBS 473.64]